MKLRTKVARSLMGVMAATAMVPAAAGVTGSVAFAGTCSPGDVDVSTSVSSKSALFTHDFELFTIPPYSSATQSLTWSNTYTSTVTGTAQATFSAGAILATAETQFGLSLADANAKTTQVNVSWNAVNNSGSYYRYIFFRGVTKVTGTWREIRCYAGVEKVAVQGSWGSWMLQHSGAVRCVDDAVLKTKFGVASLEYQAALKC